jgi:hypothetical protein
VRAAFVIALAAALATPGCCGMKLRRLDGQLNDLYTLKVEALQRNQDAAPAESQLAAVANDARAQAADCGDPKDRIALYRVAAVAAWQAGPLGARLVAPISADGIAECDALPAKDQPARDCSLIRLAEPMAVQDQLARQLVTLQRQLPPVPGAKLPSADLAPVQQLFDGFENQFERVSKVRDGLANLDVPAAFKLQTERELARIYCNAVAAWSLSGSVEGVSLQSLTASGERKERLADALQEDGIQVPGPEQCRGTPGESVGLPP